MSRTEDLLWQDFDAREELPRALVASARFPVLAQATHAIGCPLVSLCTGTRDPDDMWRAHPDNGSPEAWRELLRGREELILAADAHDVLLGVEPETGNVVSSARQARRLLDELKSPRVKIVFDPANLFHPGHVMRMPETIDEALGLLGPDMAMAHAKELGADGAMGSLAPGEGIMDWKHYIAGLRQAGFTGPVVMHGSPEAGVGSACSLLRPLLE